MTCLSSACGVACLGCHLHVPDPDQEHFRAQGDETLVVHEAKKLIFPSQTKVMHLMYVAYFESWWGKKKKKRHKIKYFLATSSVVY